MQRIQIKLTGKGFLPSQINSHLFKIDSVFDTGEIRKIGRYKGLESPYGFGIININIENSNFVKSLNEILLYIKNDFETKNIDKISVEIDYRYNKGASIEISSESTKLLSEMNGYIIFNCF